MDIETLKRFQYIATYKNITKAADKFYTSQSTLSRQIMALENELQVTLFIRNNRKFELTEAGKVFFNECNLLIRHIESVVEKTQKTWSGINGNLRIVSPGNLIETIPYAIQDFKKLYPQVDIHVEVYNFDEIPNAILHNLYDIAFTYDFASFENDELECVEIGEDDFSIIVSSDFIKNHEDNPLPYILSNLPLVLPSHAEPPFIKLMLYELNKVKTDCTKKTKYVNSTDSAIFQTSIGLGYCVVPTSLAKTSIGSNKFTIIPLDNFKTTGKIYMIYRKNISINLIKSFIEITKSYC